MEFSPSFLPHLIVGLIIQMLLVSIGATVLECYLCSTVLPVLDYLDRWNDRLKYSV